MLTVEFAHPDQSVINAQLNGSHCHGSVKVTLRFHHLARILKIRLYRCDDTEQNTKHQEEDNEKRVLSH